MKILLLSDFYPPIMGGMEKHVLLLARALERKGHEVIVYTVGHEKLPKIAEENGVKVIRSRGFFQKMPFLFKEAEKKYHPPLQDLLITNELKSIINRERPDILHAHGWILYSAMPLRKRLNVPLVATLHDYGLICPKRTLMTGYRICNETFKSKCISCGRDAYGLMKSFFSYYGVKSNKNQLKIVDKFIAVSSFVKKAHLRHLALNADDIVVIPNFYESEEDAKLNVRVRDYGGLPEDYILFVGALAPYKGVDLLIEAYKRIDTKTKLVLVGTKQPTHRYQTTKNIIIVEDAPNNVVKEAYSRCRFVVIPSVWPEPFGLVALEAMALKKPIIASGVGGLNDIVQNNETGLLVPPNDLRELEKAIRYLLKRPTLAHDMGVKGDHRLVGNFSREKIVSQVESVYEEVISFNKKDRGHGYLKPR